MCSGTVEPGRMSVQDSWRAQRRDRPPPGHYARRKFTEMSAVTVFLIRGSAFRMIGS